MVLPTLSMYTIIHGFGVIVKGFSGNSKISRKKICDAESVVGCVVNAGFASEYRAKAGLGVVVDV